MDGWKLTMSRCNQFNETSSTKGYPLGHFYLRQEVQCVTSDERITTGNIAGASQNSTFDIYVQDSQWSGGGASRID